MMKTCPDCERDIQGEYQYAQHRAFKHDDWSFLEAWAKKRGKEMFDVM